MREPLARLLRDGWVLGIAAAISIGYAVVRVVSALANMILDTAAGKESGGTFVVDVRGHEFAYFESLSASVTLVAVAVVAAWLLGRAEQA